MQTHVHAKTVVCAGVLQLRKSMNNSNLSSTWFWRRNIDIRLYSVDQHLHNSIACGRENSRGGRTQHTRSLVWSFGRLEHERRRRHDKLSRLAPDKLRL